MTDPQKETIERIMARAKLSGAYVQVALDDCATATRKLRKITEEMETNGGLSHILGEGEQHGSRA